MGPSPVGDGWWRLIQVDMVCDPLVSDKPVVSSSFSSESIEWEGVIKLPFLPTSEFRFR